ncbi:response regulator [Paenibacillus sp. GCM10023252]|uniref:response regulator n=1 Tax=Paenibacillus sp. GCM10023252 TaxID=3252649 RepID=UPI003617678B
MKVKTKLMIGSTVMITLLLVLAGAGINNITVLSAKFDEVYTVRYQKLQHSYIIRGEVNESAKYIANVLLTPNQANLDKALAMLDSAAEKVSVALTGLEKKSSSDTERQLLDEVIEAGTAYKASADQVLSLVKEGRTNEAIVLRRNEMVGLQNELIAQANKLAIYHSRGVDQAFQSAIASNEQTLMIMSIATVIGLVLGLATLLWNMRSLNYGLRNLLTLIRGFASGTVDPSARLKTMTKDEFGEVAKLFNKLADDLEEKSEREKLYNDQIQGDNWISTNLAEVIMNIQSELNLAKVSQTFIRQVTPLAGAQFGAIYIRDNYGLGETLQLQGAYAFDEDGQLRRKFILGQGLVGQAAQDGKVIELDQVPEDYIRIGSGLGNTVPHHVILYPIQHQDYCLGVIELASMQPFSTLEKRLLSELTANMGTIITNLFSRIRVDELLRESQAQSEELQAQSEELLTQQEELRRSNETLEEHANKLRASEELLQTQQEELEQSHEELLRKTQMLELQMKQTEQKNEQIEKTRDLLEKQTVQLALSSKYKSEFLTNMSHELRTPLNSLLILSQMLMDNKEGNLTSKQVEFAGTIYSSGSDLLRLIDEILDLSKISAGKMDVVIEHVPLVELDQYFRRSFMPIAMQRGVAFETIMAEGLPEEIYTDSHRAKQILKNLLSNAFKFTQQGSVTLQIRPAAGDELDELHIDEENTGFVAFDVIDTGIGIPEKKQQIIFEAFQQVDGTTSRVYGGTGLGLAISRELAALLGGSIRLSSEEGEGSTFTLYLPEFHVVGEQQPHELHDSILSAGPSLNEGIELSAKSSSAWAKNNAQLSEPAIAHIAVEDDTESITPEDKVVLIIEDDINYAKVLLDIARSRGFKGIVALQGDKGLSDAMTRKPDAILLDIQLPVMDGWTILNKLKQHADTRHIPVHVISVVDDIQQGLSMGAIAYLQKPTSKDSLDAVFSQIEHFLEHNVKRLLVVEDDAIQRNSIVELIGHDDIMITAVSTGREALEQLTSMHYDCMVLDLGLPDISGFELLDQIRQEESLHDLPVIVYTGRDLDKKEELRLKKYAGTIIIKDVKSPERLLDETTLFLHRVEANLPEEKRSMLRKLHSNEAIFEGKNILIVDDDIRNVFALSSVLESYNMNISFAENGHEALEQIERNPEVDLILMDIMMPEMDGYEAMRQIRLMPQYEKLPIIAVTAKAMKDDRDKCMEAGASDYISKPVNNEQLLSLMRVWLYQ